MFCYLSISYLIPIKPILDFYKNIVGGPDNALIISSILSFLSTLVLALITIGYVVLTKKISAETTKSVKLTEEKEKIDRTLKLIDKFDVVKYINLLLERNKYLQLEQDKDFSDEYLEAYKIFIEFMDYFDEVAILYLKDKLDDEIFNNKIVPSFVAFVRILKEVIFKDIKKRKEKADIGISYYYQNFINLALKILGEKKDIYADFKEEFENTYLDFKKLLV
jgi:hypothetical protein